MFQMNATKLVLVFLMVVAIGVVWFMDSRFFHWSDRVLPDPATMTGEAVEEPVVTNDTFNNKKFVPTNEWQKIEEGQQIPPGLHIEMNLETGEKRAKLLEPIEDNTNDKIKSLAITNVNASDDTEKTKAQPGNLHEFKSYKQLKDDLKKLNLVVKSDIEVMNDLSVKFTEQMKTFEDSESSLEKILIDLEYLLHQVDTAEVFVNNKGIELIIIPCIKSNSTTLKAQGALLLGSAASNNQKVQIRALESDVIPLLMNHISDKYDFFVQKHCLYALSSIIRRFPVAQKNVIENNGIQTLMSVFNRPTNELNMKLQLKVALLLEDLILEIEDATLTLNQEINGPRSSEAKERIRQYEELHLKNKLVENGWCHNLSEKIILLSNPSVENEDRHDLFETCGKSLLAMDKLCKTKLQGNKQFIKSLILLQDYYKNLSIKDNFYDPFYNLISQLTNYYNLI